MKKLVIVLAALFALSSMTAFAEEHGTTAAPAQTETPAAEAPAKEKKAKKTKKAKKEKKAEKAAQ